MNTLALPTKHKLTILLTSILVSLGLILLLQSKTSAATITVASGTDTISDDESCSLSEAIININDQDQTHDDCAAGTGTDDTIILPTGTITLSDDLPQLTQSITIQGQGMGESIIDGDDSYRVFDESADGLVDLSFDSLSIFNFGGLAIGSESANVVISEVEIQGGSATTGEPAVIKLLNATGDSRDFNINNTHIHDIETTTESFLHVVSIFNSELDSTTTFSIDSMTINNITNVGSINTVNLGSGAWGNSTGTVDGSVNNVTIDGITSSGGATGGIGVSSMMIEGTGTSTVEVYVNNSVITGIDSQASMFGEGSGIVIAGAAANEDAHPSVTLNAKNLILADNFTSENNANCAYLDLTSLFSGSGTPDINISSSGGNISDDNTCTDYFDQSTDQNNVSNLASTLGTLSDNGGSIPTIPLLSGSPAIDAGVTVAGLTTDARGITRPQCSAYDSGAYEYNGTCPTPNEEQGSEAGNSLVDPVGLATTTGSPNTGLQSYWLLGVKG